MIAKLVICPGGKVGECNHSSVLEKPAPVRNAIKESFGSLF
ncbi:hypothetical protein VCHA50P417_20491 [Vibrio chagasii]|nr:hypothetical protein VCHA50P417_20491 [Vibrio chagasii]